jgi:hypothetical protein
VGSCRGLGVGCAIECNCDICLALPFIANKVASDILNAITHAYTTLPHTDTHTQHSHTHIHTKHRHTHMLVHAHTYSHALMYTCTRAHTHTHTYMHRHAVCAAHQMESSRPSLQQIPCSLSPVGSLCPKKTKTSSGT